MKASYIHTKAEKQHFPAFSFSVLQKNCATYSTGQRKEVNMKSFFKAITQLIIYLIAKKKRD